MNNISLKETVSSNVGDFLLHLNYRTQQIDLLKNGIVDIINLLSDYYEEGAHLYPEVLFIDDMDFFKVVNKDIYVYYEGAILETEFSRAVKICAPLAIDGWSVFICVSPDKDLMVWGIVSIEKDVSSLTLYQEVLGMEEFPYKFFFLRNIGVKTVAIKSAVQPDLIISLSLHEIGDLIENKVEVFSRIITEACNYERDAVTTAMVKTIDRAFKTGHGNLLVAIDGFSLEDVARVFTNGVYTDISVAKMVLDKNTAGSAPDKVYAGNTLRMNLSLIVTMLNSDGITLFTTDGRVVGFHHIVDNSKASDSQVAGGSRSKAFGALTKIPFVKAVLMRRQEGDIKLYLRKQ